MNSVIKPWLIAGLVIALIGSALLSGILIVKLSRFDDSKRQADEADARAITRRAELAQLQVNVETLTTQSNALALTIVDYEKRLREMRVAQATAESLNAKQRQAESDIAQALKSLEDANRARLDAHKQMTDLTLAVERLKAERDALSISNANANALARQAEEAERRLNVATNAIASVDARRKQLETDASAAQTRFDQIQKESHTLNAELAPLRQQIQTQKDQLATFEQKAASELVQLTNRLEQARGQAADWEIKRDTAQQAATKAAQDGAVAQRVLAEAQASYEQISREQTRLVAQLTASKKEIEQARKDGADAETRRDTAKADSQKADADLAAARTQLQVFVVKQGELTREVSRLEATVERLKKEKEALEKEIGRLEAQRQDTPAEGQK